METYLIVLISLAAVIAALYLVWRLLLLYGASAYKKLTKHNAVSVDKFVGQPDGPSPGSALKTVLLHKFNLRGKAPKRYGLDLVALSSDKIDGLKVTRRKGSKDDDGTGTPVESSSSGAPPPLVVGTIRMGFGHHRIAYATCSWGLQNTNDEPRQTYFHDLLNIDSEEARMIQSTDAMYSKGSRLASELGGFVEKFWGSLTKSGDEDSLRVTYQMGEHLNPVILGLDKSSPIIASHSLVAAAAVAAGFENVINLVIDNHPQWFVVVPGALNLVQGPSNYHNFLKWGVPPDMVKLAGHWIPRDLVEGIPEACRRRKARVAARLNAADVGGSGAPRLRMIVPIGGAGAQRRYVTALIQALAPLIQQEKVELLLNAGDHAHMKSAFEDVLAECKLEYDVVPDMKGVQTFIKTTLEFDEQHEKNNYKYFDKDQQSKKNVTLFAFEDYFTAVATTDLLCNVSDVLACKPSELAFYPIPKLMIRRVGDHELYSALRASELCDGTHEAREVEDAIDYVQLFLKTDLLIKFNDGILKNNEAGVYDGCKNAVKFALERAEELKKKKMDGEGKKDK